MMYFSVVKSFKLPSCDAEDIMWKAFVSCSSVAFESEEAVLACVSNLTSLNRVCNRNKRGEKIEIAWNEESFILRLKLGDLMIVELDFVAFFKMLSVLDVEQQIDECVHRNNLCIFDQFMAEKNAEKELGL